MARRLTAQFVAMTAFALAVLAASTPAAGSSSPVATAARAPVCCFEPAWSPNGRDIAFVSGGSRAAGRFVNNVYVVRADGTRLRQAALPAAGELRGVSTLTRYGPAWSPDSARLAFTEARDHEPSVGGSRGWTSWRVLSVGHAGGVVRVEDPSARDPSWAPDGHRLALEPSEDIYWSSVDKGGIAILDVRTGERRVVVEGRSGTAAGGVSQPSWSPAGSLVAAVSGSDGASLDDAWPEPYRLHVLRLNGTAAIRPVPLPAADDRLNVGHALVSWAPDGRRLAYTNRAGRLAILSVRDGARRSTSVPGGAAAWSPDGRSIAVVSGGCLRVVRAATLRGRTIRCRVGGGAPSWSPRSDRIALGGDGGILVLRVTDAWPRLLVVRPTR